MFKKRDLAILLVVSALGLWGFAGRAQAEEGGPAAVTPAAQAAAPAAQAAAPAVQAVTPAAQAAAPAVQEPQAVLTAVSTPVPNMESVDIETMLYSPMPMVITASKHEQKLSQAPSAVYVITAEDIEQSGATQLGEAMQMAMGVFNGYSFANFMMIGGIRGFEKLPNNKIVFLINGSPWSWEIYASALIGSWLPLSLQEIDRIEIMKGPGSSLYGANAMLGVINVITKKTSDTLGSRLTLQGGDLQHPTTGELAVYNANYMYGGSLGNSLKYRMNLSWEQRNNWGRMPFAEDPIQQGPKFNTTLDYTPDDNSEIRFFGSAAYNNKAYFLYQTTGPIDMRYGKIYSANVTYKAKSPNLMVRAHWDDMDVMDGGISFGVQNMKIRSGKHGVDAETTLEPFANDTLILGADYLHTYIDSLVVQEMRIRDSGGAFFEDNYRLWDRLGLNLGMRYDYQPTTSNVLTHRLAATYEFTPDYSTRLSWGTSFRNPDFIETYYSKYTPIGGNTYVNVHGQEDNLAEKAESYELGFMARPMPALNIELNLFYTQVKDFIYYTVLQSQIYFDGSRNVIPAPFDNLGDAGQVGGEVEIGYRFASWLTGKINYTRYNQYTDKSVVRGLLSSTPQHEGNVELRAKFDNGFSANMSGHFRDATSYTVAKWGTTTATSGGFADKYFITNLRVAYAFNKLAEISVTAMDLFDQKYNDYPISATSIGRRVSAELDCRF